MDSVDPRNIDQEIIALDGKALRGSFDRNHGIKAAHIVSANKKSNEITAIPELLSMIALEGCIVTIDGMGCQYEIANQITVAKADYVLSLKSNQGGFMMMSPSTSRMLILFPNITFWM